MKKLILYIFIIFTLQSIYAIQLDSIDLKNNTFKVYGSWFSTYSIKYLQNTANDKVQISKYIDDNTMICDTKDRLKNYNFYLYWANYNWWELKTDKSKTIKVSKDIDNVIKTVSRTNIHWVYLLDIYLSKPIDEDYDIYVNNKLIPKQDIQVMWNKLQVKNLSYNESNTIPVNIAIAGKYLNTYYYTLSNKIDFSFSKIEKRRDTLKVYFRVDNIWNEKNIKLYLNNNEYEDFEFFWNYLILNLPIKDILKENIIYIKDIDKVSDTVHMNLKKYINPFLENIDVHINQIGSEDRMLVKNLYIIDGSTMYINWTWYMLTWHSYNQDISDINRRYKVDWLIWDEKQKVMNDKKDAIRKLNWYIFNAEIKNDRLIFDQPVKYKDINTIKIKYWDKYSNEFKFRMNNNTVSLLKDNNTTSSDNIYFDFKPTNILTWTNKENIAYKLWEFNINSWNNYNYVIDSLVFNIKTSQDYDFLPIKEVKLNNYNGFIKDNKVYFKNILLSRIQNAKFDLNIKFSDNLKDFKFKMLPDSITYRNLSLWWNNAQYIKKTLPKTNYTNVSISYDYVPCFDVDTNYSHCINLWYKTPSHFSYTINWSKYISPIVKKVETTKPVLNKDNDKKIQPAHKVKPKKKITLSIEKKKQIVSVMHALDKIVAKRALTNQKKAKLYKYIYDILSKYYNKMNYSEKKLVVHWLMFLTNIRYERFK